MLEESKLPINGKIQIPNPWQAILAMAWWSGQSEQNKIDYRAVHYLVDALSITRYWAKEFPAMFKNAEAIAKSRKESKS